MAFPLAWVLAHFGVVDRPNARSSHTQPTIRGGGVAILAVLAIAGAALSGKDGGGVLVWLLSAATCLAVVSFWDDLKSVPAGIRFSCHALAAITVLIALDWPRVGLGLWFGHQFAVPAWLGLVVLFFWLTGYTNAFNFMDGINGIAAGQALVTGLGMAVLAGTATGGWDSPPVLFSLAVAGAAAGFLPHNFPQARMFIGDVGSAPLGFLLAALVCWLGLADSGRLLVPLALLHANFVLDTGITLARRIWRGEQWYAAHREHFYQRLVDSRRSHAFVTGVEMTLQLVIFGLSYAFLWANGAGRIALVSLVIMIWVGFFLYCERAFRFAAALREGSVVHGAVGGERA